MNKDTKTIFKVFTAWQDDREEVWLRDMARQGWHLVKPGVGKYVFRRGEPQDVVYRLDYYSLWNNDEKQTYYDLFEQSGWELVGELVGWQYFRKPARAGEADEIYTDSESKIKKHTRVIILFGILLLMMGLNLINIGHMQFDSEVGRAAVTGLLSLAAVLDGYALLRTWLRVRALQSLP
ncbi:MAG TPA: DUF2812 domain-containing protein [Anaerolineaceae bacterium]|nr:DUF2812 domain-containing protein [Anaerolineaceae bacterium]